MFTFHWAGQFLQDLRFGARNVAKAPGFACSAILSLAFGIGAATAIFSVVYGVILDPFPYSHPETLFSFYASQPDRGSRFYPYTPDQYLDVVERTRVFEDLIASTISNVFWTGTGEPLRLRGNFVTVNTFRVMGVKPLLGRYLTEGDGAPDASPVAVLGYRFWLRQFGGDPRVLGREMRLNDKVRTVVGVMPRRFMWRGADVYLPVVFRRGQAVEGVRDIAITGRLKPGVTQAEARTALRPVLSEMMTRETGEHITKFRVMLDDFYETFPSGIRRSLWILFGAVGLLLLIACINVSGLLLARAAARAKEMGVRASLGASRSRLVRQLLTESALIGLTAGLSGALLAYASLHAILAIVPPNTIPDESEVKLNVPVLLFALAVSLAAAFLFGLAPALQAARADLTEVLKSAGRGMSGAFREGRMRNAFVVAQVALAIVLLVAASLVLRTLLRLEQVQVGLQPERVLTMAIPLPERRYPTREARNAFFRQLLERLRAIPGLQEVAINQSVHPFVYFGARATVPGSAVRGKTRVVVSQISSEYPALVNLHLLQGRFLTPDDVNAAKNIGVVNEKFAKFYFAGKSPLGASVTLSNLLTPPARLANDTFEIIGVASDAPNVGLRRETLPEIYIPFTATGYVGMSPTLLASGSMPASSLIKPIEDQLHALDPDQPAMEVRTLRQLLDAFGYSEPRFSLFLFSVFAVLGLALSALGVYAVMNYSVIRRTQEIGIRMALGAQRSNIHKMVVGSGAKILGIGVAAGLAASIGLNRLIGTMIWGVSPFDPLSFAAVIGIVFLIGLLACVRPALMASHLDPIVALRQE
jgi:predicted permease